MFGLGFGEILVIGIFFIILYSPKKIPAAVKTFAKFLVKFRRTINDIRYNTLNEIEKFSQEELKPITDVGREIEKDIRAIGDNVNKAKQVADNSLMLDKPVAAKNKRLLKAKKVSSSKSTPKIKPIKNRKKKVNNPNTSN